MCPCDRDRRHVCGDCREHRYALAPWQLEVIASEREAEKSDPLDPATRVLDALGREWAVKNNGVWAALGHAMSVDCYAVLVAKYGPCEVLG